jgi:hypothetical protein
MAIRFNRFTERSNSIFRYLADAPCMNGIDPTGLSRLLLPDVEAIWDLDPRDALRIGFCSADCARRVHDQSENYCLCIALCGLQLWMCPME